MSLYSGNTATEASTGNSFEPGCFKFRITEAKVTDWGAVNYTMETKDAKGNEGPQVFDSLKLQSTSDAMKAEIDRRLTTMLGKPEINAPEDLVGKVGYVMLRKGPKYLEASPWGSYFTADKKSATGSTDSFAKAEENAKAYDYTQDEWVMNKLQQSQGHLASVAGEADDSSDMPF